MWTFLFILQPLFILSFHSINNYILIREYIESLNGVVPKQEETSETPKQSSEPFEQSTAEECPKMEESASEESEESEVELDKEGIIG